MDSVSLFTSKATLVYFGEPQPKVDQQAKNLYQLAKSEIMEWVRGELLDICRTPGVDYREVRLCLPACDNNIEVSVSTQLSSESPFVVDSNNPFCPVRPPFGMSGSPYSDGNYVTPIGKMPYPLYRKIVTEETPVSRLFDFLASEYKKLTDEAKTTMPSEQELDALFIHDILYLHRYGSIIQAFGAMRAAKAA